MSLLNFGLREMPDVTCAWGARLIWPNDLVHDRQDLVGSDPTRSDLIAWLNDGPLRSALDEAAKLAREYVLSPGDDNTVTLYEDERGLVRANPQGSHGYLYVAAWLK